MEMAIGKGKRDRDPKRVWLAGHPCKVDDSMERVKKGLELSSRFMYVNVWKFSVWSMLPAGPPSAYGPNSEASVYMLRTYTLSHMCVHVHTQNQKQNLHFTCMLWVFLPVPLSSPFSLPEGPLGDCKLLATWARVT